MTVVKSTGLRILCYEPLIKMITVKKPMAYHSPEQVHEPNAWTSIEQVHEPRLEPVLNGCISQGLNQYPVVINIKTFQYIWT